ncbi:MAG TPA: M20/M25/M40 family metallo-hydrolase, partial [Actinomycetota bacterium]|nr:M20/M25/M40 family metallo-hydrolase [Actinomycetota bacterium]
GPRRGKLVLQLVADEEVLGPHGTMALHQRGLAGADAAIVGEPTDLNVAVAERGMLWIIARTAGVAAHGSRPDLGVNAIEEMARAIPVLRALRTGRSHPLLGEPSLNFGTVEGGSKINIVADACRLAMDRRTLPGETDQGIIDQMQAALKDAGLSVTLEIVHRADPVEVDPGEEIVRRAVEAHEAVRGRPGAIGAMTGATDAHVLAGTAGIPTIIFGPGSLDQAHTTGEHVAITDLIDGARIYAELFDAYLSG